VPWRFTLAATKQGRKSLCRCHGLVPWRFTFPAEPQALITESIKRETPRRKAVASLKVLRLSCSSKRDSPRRKAVASKIRSSHKFLHNLKLEMVVSQWLCFQKSHGDVNAGTGAGTASRNLMDRRRIDATFVSTSSGVSAVLASWNTQSMSSL
jgi:hypothetical protein